MPEEEANRRPQVLVPYPGPDPDPDALDIFVYLRPETNGVEVESTILSVIQKCEEYREDIKLVYMANIPGGFITEQRIVERHYAVRLYYAVHGGEAFSDDMRRQFEDFYGEPFDPRQVLGAFEALREFEMRPEDLFSLWVEDSEITRIAGQVVKRVRDRWVVNYDMPALLHKNNSDTDIAVMAFRTRAGYPQFFALASQMKARLVERNLLNSRMPIARAVHLSRSPFEQLLDARDYLIDGATSDSLWRESSFAHFLIDRGLHIRHVQGLIEHPIVRFDFGVDAPLDQNLLDLCEGFTYEDAWAIINRMVSQSTIPGQLFYEL